MLPSRLLFKLYSCLWLCLVLNAALLVFCKDQKCTIEA